MELVSIGSLPSVGKPVYLRVLLAKKEPWLKVNEAYHVPVKLDPETKHWLANGQIGNFDPDEKVQLIDRG